MRDVADERHLQSRDAAELDLQRQEIEQRLRRMGVAAVAGVDDVALERLGETVGKTGLGVTRDDHAHAHRRQRNRGIGDRLAFAEARRTGR